MANQGGPFQMDTFSGMQQQQQQLQDQQQQQQQALRGVPAGLAPTWSDVPEQYRQANVNPSQLSQQPSAAHQQQLNQSHQSMAQTMNMMANRDLASQLHRQTPHMQHALMNQQSQYSQLAHGQFQHPNIPQNITQNPNLNQNPNPANQTHLMSVPPPTRQTPTMLSFNPQGGSFNSANPALVRFQNMNTNVPNGANQVQHQPFPGQNPSAPLPGSSQAQINQIRGQSARPAQQFEAHLTNFLNEARSSMQSQDPRRMQSCKEQALPFKSKAQEEKERWSKAVQAKLWAPDVREVLIKEAERYQTYEARYEHILKLLEDAMRGVFQQMSATNMMGMSFQNNRASMTAQTQPQQQWGGAQRDNVGMQTNPGQQTFPNSNLTNQAFNQFGNHPATSGGQPSNMGAITHQMGAIQNRLSGGAPPSNTQAEQDPAAKANFFKILQAAGLEGIVFVAGHSVDLWALYRFGASFSPAQMQTPHVFRVIGGHLGLPAEGTPGMVSPQAAAALQDHYNKVTIALDNARSNNANRMNPNNPGANPPGNAIAISNSNPLNPTPGFSSHNNALPAPAQQAQQAQVNEGQLRIAKNNYPYLEFGEFTPDVVTKLPTARFEQILRHFINERTNNSRVQGVGAAAQNRVIPPRPTSAMVPGANGGQIGQASQGQEGQIRQISSEEVQEVVKFQQHLIETWRQAFNQAKLEPVPIPANQTHWRHVVQLTVQLLRSLLPGLGLYFFVSRKQAEVQQVVQISARIVKQMLSLQNARPNVPFIPMQQLQNWHSVLQSRAQEMSLVLDRVRVPPELRSMVAPTEPESKTLWGFMPQTNPQQPLQQPPPQQPGFSAAIQAHVTPNLHHNVPTTPIPPPTMSTPAPSHPAPTPPHAPAQGTLNPLAHRRNGFSEGAGNISSPSYHLTSPAPAPAPTPPGGTVASKSPKSRATRPRAPTQARKKPPRGANTPTPAADAAPTPATAPTPAAVGMKRSLDEAETPSGQSDPPIKRVKTEPTSAPLAPATAAPPAIVKPPTPPPQISSDIDLAQVRSEEDAKLLLENTFNRAENEAETAAAGGTESNVPDLLQWLSQLISSTPIPDPSTASTSALGSELTVGQSNALTSDDNGFDDIFDLDGYCAADKDAPALPELDHTKHATVSPESHNDVTTTPPSQTNGPARGTGSSGNGVSTVKREPQVDMDAGFLSFENESLFAFSYNEPVNPLEDAWAIAQG